MVSMSADMTIETKAKGGISASLARSVLGGRAFVNTYKAGGQGGRITLAPALPGDLAMLRLTGHNPMKVQSKP
jgi:uncharacterized protein (AIM24 family)